MTTSLIIGLIISYFLIGSIWTGWARSDTNDDPDSAGIYFIAFFIWPLLMLFVVVIGITDLSKAGFDILKKKKLPKIKKKKEELKQIRVQLEETRKEMLEEQRIIAELEAELEQHNATRQTK